MNTFIIRKPKFMRNEAAMLTHIKTAEALSKTFSKTDMTLAERYELLERIKECWQRAAEAGGFRNLTDFFRWMDMESNNT